MTRASDREDRWLADRWEQRHQPAVLVAWIAWWCLGVASLAGSIYLDWPLGPMWSLFAVAVPMTTFSAWRASVRRTAVSSPRVDERQARRLAEAREREARLRRERPDDYPAAPWMGAASEGQPSTAPD